MTGIRRLIVSILVATALFAACGESGQTFSVTLRPVSNDPLPVTLIDQTGLVVGISQAAADATIPSKPVLHTDLSEPKSAILTWLGGACDADATVTLQLQSENYIVTLRTRERAGSGCPLLGVPRGIRISTSAPLPIDSVIVTGR